jgi:hypothetical protein
MSVKACDRSGCPNIMCDLYMPALNKYLCSECWLDLLAYKNIWSKETEVWQVKHKIMVFLNSKAEDIGDNKLEPAVEAEFDRLTKGEPDV